MRTLDVAPRQAWAPPLSRLRGTAPLKKFIKKSNNGNETKLGEQEDIHMDNILKNFQICGIIHTIKKVWNSLFL
jgi:hypothetical protein